MFVYNLSIDLLISDSHGLSMYTLSMFFKETMFWLHFCALRPCPQMKVCVFCTFMPRHYLSVTGRRQNFSRVGGQNSTHAIFFAPTPSARREVGERIFLL